MHLDGGAIRCFGYPYVEIFALSRLEKKHVITVIELSELIELIQFRLSVELCVFTAVWQQGIEVIEQVSMSVGHASGAENENSLLVLSGGAIGGSSLGGGGFGQGLIDGSHVVLPARRVWQHVIQDFVWVSAW